MTQATITCTNTPRRAHSAVVRAALRSRARIGHRPNLEAAATGKTYRNELSLIKKDIPIYIFELNRQPLAERDDMDFSCIDT